jgi:hypothetical protein
MIQLLRLPAPIFPTAAPVYECCEATILSNAVEEEEVRAETGNPAEASYSPAGRVNAGNVGDHWVDGVLALVDEGDFGSRTRSALLAENTGARRAYTCGWQAPSRRKARGRERRNCIAF